MKTLLRFDVAHEGGIVTRVCPRCRKRHIKIPRECLVTHYEKTLSKMIDYCAQNEKWSQQLLNETWN
jgi:hypothetical protein